jgi:hypothetical protein
MKAMNGRIRLPRGPNKGADAAERVRVPNRHRPADTKAEPNHRSQWIAPAARGQRRSGCHPDNAGPQCAPGARQNAPQFVST